MNIISTFLERGMLIEPDLIPFLKNFDTPLIVDIIQQLTNEKFISKKIFLDNLDKINLILENLKGKEHINPELIRTMFNSVEIHNTKNSECSGNNFKIIENWDIPSRKISVDDFVKYFQNRFIELKSILQTREELENLTSINKISSQRQNITIIGMVNSIRITKNRNIIIELEDLTGKTAVLVSSAKEDLIKKAKNIVLDEVIAVKCTGSSEILFVNDIIFPDVFTEKKKIESEEYAAFISDLHVGSSKFLEENFLNFLRWLNGEIGDEKQKEFSKKIKYLFIIGDNVDGVGIYPGQEELLLINDIKAQYEKLAELLRKIRSDINIFMCPGQHDSERIAEPQPPISEIYAPSLYKIKNLHLVSNPALIEIGSSKNSAGLKVLMYHGANLHGLVESIEELRLSKAMRTPTKITKHVLIKRHLSPQHDSSDYIPTKEGDPFVIRQVPDIIATGDIHRSDVSTYHNVILIASSCWQSITPFEEKIGHEPDPCKVPILNLKTGQVNILDFS